MARLFVPTGFEASKVSPDLYRFLLTELADDAYVLLEFHSGGRNQRQVDVAVLGPYGVDIVEVKAKTGGAVIASANGPWQIRRDDGKVEEIPLNGAAHENPYDQVDHTAADFKRCLETELGLTTKVFPLVVVPSYRRDHNLRNRGFVWAANGLESFKSSLRSWRPYKDLPQSLDVQHWERIVNALGLTELRAGDPVSVWQGGSSVASLVQSSIETAQASARSAPEPVRLINASPSRVASTVPDSATLVPRYKPKHRAAWLALGLASCVVTALGLGWITPRGETVVPVVTEQLKSAQPPLIETKVPEVVSPEVALPGTTYRPVQETAVAITSEVTIPDGEGCPSSQPVKGNINSEGERIFHVAGQKYYEQTRPEQCFSSAEAALVGGFRASLR